MFVLGGDQRQGRRPPAARPCGLLQAQLALPCLLVSPHPWIEWSSNRMTAQSDHYACTATNALPLHPSHLLHPSLPGLASGAPIAQAVTRGAPLAPSAPSPPPVAPWHELALLTPTASGACQSSCPNGGNSGVAHLLTSPACLRRMCSSPACCWKQRSGPVQQRAPGSNVGDVAHVLPLVLSPCCAVFLHQAPCPAPACLCLCGLKVW